MKHIKRLNKLSGLKKEKEQPAPVDAELFRQAVEGVVPLSPSNRASPSAAPRHAADRSIAIPLQTIADNLSDHGAGDEPLNEFMRSGISRMTLRKLRRGQWTVQDSLDLHGLNSDAARKLLQEFLHDAMRHDLRCVCVIHGKGWHTDGGEGILKTLTRHWLTQCAEVLAFCEPPPHEGGGGAVWVLLKSGG